MSRTLNDYKKYLKKQRSDDKYLNILLLSFKVYPMHNIQYN